MRSVRGQLTTWVLSGGTASDDARSCAEARRRRAKAGACTRTPAANGIEGIALFLERAELAAGWQRAIAAPAACGFRLLLERVHLPPDSRRPVLEPRQKGALDHALPALSAA